MQVEYVDHMGSDLTVVNAARVSFSKHKTEFDPEVDGRLISYLARHNHWTPFGHPTITLRIFAPVFVRTQLFKHKVGFTENEVSRRYVDKEPQFYIPDKWRGRPKDNAKQGSDETVEIGTIRYTSNVETWEDATENFYQLHCESSLQLYEALIEGGVAPEQARMVLPQSMYTEWYWTGSLAAYARMCKLRLDPHAQAETKEIAEMCSVLIEPLYPYSWRALID